MSIPVVILCGGLGTRLREETEYRPKPLVEIGGRPILWHIMKIYSHYGFRDFILCLGYRGNMIKEYFLNYEAMNNDFTICLGNKHQLVYHGAHEEQDFRVTLAETGAETGRAGVSAWSATSPAIPSWSPMATASVTLTLAGWWPSTAHMAGWLR